jgi:hypothetical protein
LRQLELVVGEDTGEVKQQLGGKEKVAEELAGQLSDHTWLSMMMQARRRKVARRGPPEKLLDPWLGLGMRWRPRHSCTSAWNTALTDSGAHTCGHAGVEGGT